VNAKAIESGLLELIDAFAGRFPSEQAAGMRQLVLAGESGVAFENLCTQLFEYDVVPDRLTIGRLHELGSTLEVDSKYWQRLRPDE